MTNTPGTLRSNYFQFCISLLQTVSEEDYLEENAGQDDLQNAGASCLFLLDGGEQCRSG